MGGQAADVLSGGIDYEWTGMDSCALALIPSLFNIRGQRTP